MSDGKRVVVVGAGLAGLCCARTLQRAGYQAEVYEASNGVGGRVRTDTVDGFRLDRGFQTLYTAYPAIRQEIDPDALNLCAFDPGALVLRNGQQYQVGDAFRMKHPLLGTFSSLFGMRDRRQMRSLRQLVTGMDLTDIFLLPDTNMREYLLEYGISQQCLESFFSPFFGSVFLQRSLDTSSRMFAFVFKMLAEGQAAVPAMGMGEIPKQLASGLASGTLHLNRQVKALEKTGDRVTGIRLADDTTVSADTVVVATPADVAAQLTGLKLSQEHRSALTLYFEVPKAFMTKKTLMLFADPNIHAGPNSLVNNATLLTNIAPSYAPPDKHLLSVSVLGDPKHSDEQLAIRVKREIAPHFKESEPEAWRLLKVYRIPWAQFTQPAGVFDRLPSPNTGIPGLILSGEILSSSSLHGALVSGQKAAAAAMHSGRK